MTKGTCYTESVINNITYAKHIKIVNSQNYSSSIDNFESLKLENFNSFYCNPPLGSDEVYFQKFFNDYPGQKSVKDQLEESLNQKKVFEASKCVE